MEQTHKIVLEPMNHRGQECIAFRFAFDRKLIEIIKQISGIKFSISNKCWYVARQDKTLREIFQLLEQHKVPIDHPKLKIGSVAAAVVQIENSTGHMDDQRRALRMMEQKLHLKGYSTLTAKTYLSQFGLFLRFFGSVNPMDIIESEIRNYLLYLERIRRQIGLYKIRTLDRLKNNIADPSHF